MILRHKLVFEELPSFLPGMKSWGANVGDYSFIIAYEDGTVLKPEERKQWVGYSVSYKVANSPTFRIDKRYGSLDEAKQIATNVYNRLVRRRVMS